MKNNKKKQVYEDRREYIVKLVENSEADRPVLLGEVTEIETTGKKRLYNEVYYSPKDFIKQMTRGIRFHMDDEMISQGKVRTVRISLVYAYTIEPEGH